MEDDTIHLYKDSNGYVWGVKESTKILEKESKGNPIRKALIEYNGRAFRYFLSFIADHYPAECIVHHDKHWYVPALYREINDPSHMCMMDDEFTFVKAIYLGKVVKYQHGMAPLKDRTYLVRVDNSGELNACSVLETRDDGHILLKNEHTSERYLVPKFMLTEEPIYKEHIKAYSLANLHKDQADVMLSNLRDYYS